jgi:hypothetical protein
MSTFIAVVMDKKVTADLASKRTLGDWSCFVGKKEDAVVKRAMDAIGLWERSGSRGPYEVLLGTLTARVSIPTTYRLVPLSEVRKVRRRKRLDAGARALKEHRKAMAAQKRRRAA